MRAREGRQVVIVPGRARALSAPPDHTHEPPTARAFLLVAVPARSRRPELPLGYFVGVIGSPHAAHPVAGVPVDPADGAPVVGMIGGGQLARMTAEAATALGVGFRVLAGGPRESAALVVRDTWLGSHDDPHVVASFAAGCDVVTFDHEHVPADCLAAMQAQGTVIRPGPGALLHAQDKHHMRAALSDLAGADGIAGTGVTCPAWTVVADATEVATFAAVHGWPVVLKVSRGGYDGRGVWVVTSEQEADRVLQSAMPGAPGAVMLAEAFVPFDEELAAQVARSPSGQAVAYPIVRTRQVDGICSEVIAPAPGLPEGVAVRAQEAALRIAQALDVTGMLAVELFRAGEDLIVNELAMRPHNSGHWTIDGAVTSQFENHLRAVLDLPLGDPRQRAPYAVMVNVLGTDVPGLYSGFRHVLARDPAIKVHLYGKEVRPGRKLGHVTLVGADWQDLLARGRHAADYLSGIIDE